MREQKSTTLTNNRTPKLTHRS